MQNLISQKEDIIKAIQDKFAKNGVLDLEVIKEFCRVSSEINLIETFRKVA